jgi:hypothetical protein
MHFAAIGVWAVYFNICKFSSIAGSIISLNTLLIQSKRGILKPVLREHSHATTPDERQTSKPRFHGRCPASSPLPLIYNSKTTLFPPGLLLHRIGVSATETALLTVILRWPLRHFLPRPSQPADEPRALELENKLGRATLLSLPSPQQAALRCSRGRKPKASKEGQEVCRLDHKERQDSPGPMPIYVMYFSTCQNRL